MGATEALGGGGHGLQQEAAHGMAVGGVHALEVIDVDEEQGQGLRLGGGRAHRLGQLRL